MKDQRAPRHRILLLLPLLVLVPVIALGSWAPAAGQDQFTDLRRVLAPNCQTGGNQNLQNCGCNSGNLNNEELREIAPDEVSAQGTMSTALRTQQLRVLGTRLAALRGGAPGITMTAPKLVVEQEPMLMTQVPTASDAGRPSAPVPERLGIFVNGSTAWGDRDRTDLEEGYDFKNYGVTVGADYRFTNNFIAGIALSYYNTDADINFDLGTVEADSYGVSLYGTYYTGGFFIDMLAGFSWNNYDSERRVQVPTTGVNGVATGDTDGKQYTLALGAGYEIRYKMITFTPLARLEYVDLHVDSFEEKNGDGMALELKKQSADSLQTSLGMQIAVAFGLPFGVLVPQARGEWRHEFLDDQRSIKARFLDDPNPDAFFTTQTDKPDRDFFVVGAGLSAVFARGMSAFVNYETFLGLNDFTRHEVTGGIRFAF